MNTEPRNLDNGEAERLLDKSIPIEERIEIARSIVRKGEELVILLARNGTADGTPFSDRDVGEDELMRITQDLGFENNAYETVSRYEWRTASKLYEDLVLQVVEGPIDIGGSTELFPSGRAWSQYDHINTLNILVSSRE